MLTFNPTASENCLVGFLNTECGGAVFGRDSYKEFKFEAISITQLIQSDYLLYVKYNEEHSHDLMNSMAQLKYYVEGKEDAAMIYDVSKVI
jgi:hypothetical protein